MDFNTYLVTVHVPFAIIFLICVYAYYLYREDESDFLSDFKERMFFLALTGVIAGPSLAVFFLIMKIGSKLDIVFRHIIYTIKNHRIEKLKGRLIKPHQGETKYIILKAESFTKWHVLGRYGRILIYTHREARLLNENDSE